MMIWAVAVRSPPFFRPASMGSSTLHVCPGASVDVRIYEWTQGSRHIHEHANSSREQETKRLAAVPRRHCQRAIQENTGGANIGKQRTSGFSTAKGPGRAHGPCVFATRHL